MKSKKLLVLLASLALVSNAFGANQTAPAGSTQEFESELHNMQTNQAVDPTEEAINALKAESAVLAADAQALLDFEDADQSVQSAVTAVFTADTAMQGVTTLSDAEAQIIVVRDAKVAADNALAEAQRLARSNDAGSAELTSIKADSTADVTTAQALANQTHGDHSSVTTAITAVEAADTLVQDAEDVETAKKAHLGEDLLDNNIGGVDGALHNAQEALRLREIIANSATDVTAAQSLANEQHGSAQGVADAIAAVVTADQAVQTAEDAEAANIAYLGEDLLDNDSGGVDGALYNAQQALVSAQRQANGRNTSSASQRGRGRGGSRGGSRSRGRRR